MTSKEHKPSRSELKRQAILNAAKSAFQESGVQGTSMDELAARAQVSKRTVYNHFESKEALVIHLLTDLWKQATSDTGFEYCVQTPLNAQLVKLLESEIAVVNSAEYLNLARVAFGHYFYHPDTLQQQMAQFDKKQTALYAWLVAAKEDGKLTYSDPEFAMSQLHNLIKGSCFWPQLIQVAPLLTQEESSQLAQETANMFLAYYQL